MRKLILLIFFGVVGLFSASYGVQLEFSAGLAFDKPVSKPLPGLKTGYGYAFSIGLLPYEKAGISLGISSTDHQFEAGLYNGKNQQGDSHRSVLYAQLHYRFLRLNTTEFEAYLGGSYNSINGGDSSGGYLSLGQINREDIGYSGYGGIIGAGVIHPIASGYYVNFNLKYVILSYSKHQVPGYEYSDSRKGNSLLFNLVIVYRVDFLNF
jgi:hypothetical protein